jgi:hypothetical protein
MGASSSHPCERSRGWQYRPAGIIVHTCNTLDPGRKRVYNIMQIQSEVEGTKPVSLKVKFLVQKLNAVKLLAQDKLLLYYSPGSLCTWWSW